MKKFLGILLFITSCCSQNDLTLIKDAQSHAQKLRKHFIGYNNEDVSSLIAETQEISYRLKAAKFNDLATKFDSYTDVLMYGNRTINESIQDTKELIRKGVCDCDYRPCVKGVFSR